MSEYELKLQSGKRVTWQGRDALDAAHRYVEMHPSETVIATRPGNRHGLFLIEDAKRLSHRIIEPGNHQWGKDNIEHAEGLFAVGYERLLGGAE